ncbi:MAG: DNA-3-methyladenine glycosylase 2 family protein [bacterium]
MPASNRDPSPAVPLTKESLARAAKLLAGRDKNLGAILKQHGPPPLWARKPGFATLVQIILEQQVSLASAASLFARLNKSVIPFQPAQMLLLGEPHLKSLGLTRQKTAYCLHLSQLLNEKHLNLSQLSRGSDEDAKARLMEVKGIGSWSADIYLLLALRRPDIWPASDLALAIAAKQLMELKVRPGPDELNKISERWRPFRSVAARMLWQYYLAERKQWRKGEAHRRKANC